jgi:hypothetical protein
LTGVPVDVIHQWDQDGAPEMAEKLLMLWIGSTLGMKAGTGFYSRVAFCASRIAAGQRK